MGLQKIISGRDMTRILQFCGYNHSEFAKFIDKSRSFVSRNLAEKQTVPLKYVDELIRFVGIQNYSLATSQIEQEDRKQKIINENEVLISQLQKEIEELKKWGDQNYKGYMEIKRLYDELKASLEEFERSRS